MFVSIRLSHFIIQCCIVAGKRLNPDPPGFDIFFPDLEKLKISYIEEYTH